MTMAAAADQMVYLIWLPILLGSKAFADRFNRWMKVPANRIELMEQAAGNFDISEDAPSMIGFLYLGLLAIGFTAIALYLSKILPPVVIAGTTAITAGTWLILLVTTFALFASVTPARRLPAAQPIAMAIIYVFVARVGATMDLSVVDWDKMLGFMPWLMSGSPFMACSSWPVPGFSAWTSTPWRSHLPPISAVQLLHPSSLHTTVRHWCRRPF